MVKNKDPPKNKLSCRFGQQKHKKDEKKKKILTLSYFLYSLLKSTGLLEVKADSMTKLRGEKGPGRWRHLLNLCFHKV